MSSTHAHEIDAAFDAVTAIVRDRLSRNRRIRRNLPGEGRLRIDRQLPFLCVYREPVGDQDAGTRELVTTEAAYLLASGDASHEAGLVRLIGTIGETLREHFGALLVVQIWAEEDRPERIAPRDVTRPGFRIVATESQTPALAATVAALREGLQQIQSQGWPADVVVVDDQAPPLQSLLDDDGVHFLGIAVRPVYRDSTGALFPAVLRSLRRQLAMALRKAFFAFTGREQTPAGHYESLGPSALVKAARLVDQQLSEISQSFDFVLQTVPLNSATAWEEFQADGLTKAPTFYYRPLPFDPADLKRRLFEIPVSRIEDATLIQLFEEKQDLLDRQLTALKNIDSPAFYYDSVQLYGRPDEGLVELARAVLAGLNDAPASPSEDVVHTDEIVAAAREQIDHYHQQLPGFVATVHVRNDLASTMMVAQDRLYVSATAALARHNVEPLLNHEIGTHLLTYFNGRQQPFQQLYAGLAGYEELQEGLAVLAEYLTGGLTHGRLRTIACRVLAVQAVVEGRSFVDAFHLLHDEHGLAARSAFMTALRAYRGGGLTKDAIYLRGLRDLLAYLREGHDAEPLYVGKIALAHVSLVQELRRRSIVGPPALLPKFWDESAAAQRLDRCRRFSLLELLETDP